jgi:hypothetical protein
MVSIKRLLERRHDTPDESEVPEVSSKLRRLVAEEIEARGDLRHVIGSPDFIPTLRELLLRLREPTSSLELAAIANDALEVTANDMGCVTRSFEEQISQMQSMVAMLAETLADIPGQSDTSVARLQGIEQQIVRASSLDDIRLVKQNLASCLTAIKEAAAQQKRETLVTGEHPRDDIERAPQPPVAVATPAVPQANNPFPAAGVVEYVAVFVLQRAGHILKRFGQSVSDQMLLLIGEGLKSAQGPTDRLMRWKGPSFVLHISSTEDTFGIRRRLSAAVGKISQRYIEVGENSALLAVGLDWTVFPRAKYPSADAMFAEVDAFLGRSNGRW